MKQWWVYELRAGDWLYIGQTTNPKGRLITHRSKIRLQEKPARWDRALKEFPIPEDWEMTVVAGPFDSREEAMSVEERLHREHWNYQGRLWDRCGNMPSDEMKSRVSSTMSGREFSDEHKSNLSASLTGRTHSDETIEKMKEKARLREARKREEKAQKSLE